MTITYNWNTPWWSFKTTAGSNTLFWNIPQGTTLQFFLNVSTSSLYFLITVIQQYYIYYLILHTVKHLYQVGKTQIRNESTPQAHDIINSEEQFIIMILIPGN